MKRVIVRDTTPIPPFGEPARELRILNKPLWLIQRDLLARHCKGYLEIDALSEVPTNSDEELLVYRDNLYFNADLIDTFVAMARATGHACQIGFSQQDRAITTHALPLQEGIRLQPAARPGEESVYAADVYYYPAGSRQPAQVLVIDSQAYEMGYYHVPHYMAPNQGELVFQIPNRVFLSIENWVHVYLANTPLGVFNWARQNDEQMQRARLRNMLHWTKEDRQALRPKLELVLSALMERINPFEERWRNHFLACKKLVKIGKNCSIDPTAIIHGPTVIGDNVYIGPGTVITNSLIGNNANIMQGCQVMLSVISDRCFLAFNAAVFMSSLMENSMLAQNTTLQLCAVGRNTFIGANNVFTDFHLLGGHQDNIQTYHRGQLEDVGMPVLGSAVGHHCKIGSGFVVYPGRMIGSNTVLILDNRTNLINKNVNVPGQGVATGIPGAGEEELSEEVRQTVYRWPYLYDPDSGTLHDPVDDQHSYHGEPEELYNTKKVEDGLLHGGAHEPHSIPDEADAHDSTQSEALRKASHRAYASAVHVGG